MRRRQSLAAEPRRNGEGERFRFEGDSRGGKSSSIYRNRWKINKIVFIITRVYFGWIWAIGHVLAEKPKPKIMVLTGYEKGDPFASGM